MLIPSYKQYQQWKTTEQFFLNKDRRTDSCGRDLTVVWLWISKCDMSVIDLMITMILKSNQKLLPSKTTIYCFLYAVNVRSSIVQVTHDKINFELLLENVIWVFKERKFIIIHSTWTNHQEICCSNAYFIKIKHK